MARPPPAPRRHGQLGTAVLGVKALVLTFLAVALALDPGSPHPRALLDELSRS